MSDTIFKSTSVGASFRVRDQTVVKTFAPLGGSRSDNTWSQAYRILSDTTFKSTPVGASFRVRDQTVVKTFTPLSGSRSDNTLVAGPKGPAYSILGSSI